MDRTIRHWVGDQKRPVCPCGYLLMDVKTGIDKDVVCPRCTRHLQAFWDLDGDSGPWWILLECGEEKHGKQQ